MASDAEEAGLKRKVTSGVALVQVASYRDETLREVADRKVERIIKCSKLFFATRLSDICCAGDSDTADALVLSGDAGISGGDRWTTCKENARNVTIAESRYVDW